MEKLWNKNFTIITVGAFVSMMGRSITAYAFGLLVYEGTGSELLYALTLVANQLPSFLLPVFIGSFLDRFSRRKAIYILEYITCFLMMVAAGFIFMGFDNPYLVLCFVFLAGSVGCCYQIAYESFYPCLITKGNYRQAYSVSSLMGPLATTVMLPVAGLVYDAVGVIPLLLFVGVAHGVAATFDMQINAIETHVKEVKYKGSYKWKDFMLQTKEGIDYLMSEKSLLFVALFFGVITCTGQLNSTMRLPFVTGVKYLNQDAAVLSFVLTFSSLGRILGASIQYFISYPVKRRYQISITVYAVITILEALFFYGNVPLMCLNLFVAGLFSVTSYNIRISATNSYVPDDKRGRFNAVFVMMTAIGGVFGNLISGVLMTYIAIPHITLGVIVVLFSGLYFILIRNKETVKKLYNREV